MIDVCITVVGVASRKVAAVVVIVYPEAVKLELLRVSWLTAEHCPGNTQNWEFVQHIDPQFNSPKSLLQSKDGLLWPAGVCVDEGLTSPRLPVVVDGRI